MFAGRTKLILVVAVRKWIPRPHGQNMRLGFPPVIETDRGVQPEKVSVAGAAGMKTLDPIVASSGHHVAMPVENEINFFRRVVVMRKIGPARGKLHHEEAGDDDSAIELISGALSSSEKQSVLG